MFHARGWLGIGALVAGLVWAPGAHALVFTVDAPIDAVDATPGDGICATALLRRWGQVCTLRAATQEANALGGAHTIVLAEGTYRLSLKTGDAFVDSTSDASGPLKLRADVTLAGAGSLTTAIDADDLYRVLTVSDATVAISGVTIQHGRVVPNGLFAERSGGGIFNAGTLTITASRVRNNAAGSGGGIFNAGVLAMTSVFVGNNAAVVGGGISTKGSLTMTGSTVGSNDATSDGGGIANSGTLTLDRSTVAHNAAYDGDGGGILNVATMVMDRSTVASNTAGASGGGIATYTATSQGVLDMLFGGGTAAPPAVAGLTHSTVRNNSGFSGDGGGIVSSGTLTLVNSTISGNGAERAGGGIAYDGTMSLTNSTIAHNAVGAARGAGGGLFGFGPGDDGGSAPEGVLRNTLVADNASEDCGGTPAASLGHNLDSDGTCALSAAGDLPSANAMLAPLALNGGSTMTHALLPGSAAIDTAGSAGCPADDQRGVARPQGFGCDIGAFEWNGDPPGSNLSISISADRPAVRRGDVLRYALTATNAGASSVDGVTVVDRLPSHVAVTNVRSSHGTCAVALQGNTATVTCSLGRLPAGATATVTLDVTPRRRGMLVNIVTVTGDVSDPDVRDNRARVKTEVR